MVEAARIELASEDISTEATTCLSCDLSVRFFAALTGRIRWKLAQMLFRDMPFEHKHYAKPAKRRPFLPRRLKNRKNVATVTQLEPIHYRHLLVSHLFYETNGTSACNLCFIYPRRNLIAPTDMIDIIVCCSLSIPPFERYCQITLKILLFQILSLIVEMFTSRQSQ